MLVASFWLAVIVALPPWTAWLVTGAAVAITVLLLLSWGSARVQVGEHWFRAGRARIDSQHLGAVQVLDAAGTRRVAGVDADARAFLLLRPYLARSVRVALIDPRDPTPYWLVNTRHPEALATALTEVTNGRSPADRVDTPHSQED